MNDRSFFSRSLIALACTVQIAAAQAQDAQAPQAQGGYRIGAGDVIAVTAFGGEGLSGDYRVSVDGSISYPLIGNVSVSGMTVTEVSQMLETGLAQHIPGLSVSAAISHYAPVFVYGDVQNPGSYEYRPGMIALELMVLGGGLSRAPGTLESSQIQLIAVRQEYNDLQLQMLALDAARARFAAEYGETEFSPPAADPDPSLRAHAQSIVEGEATLFAMRRKALADEERGLAAQEKSYADEIDSIARSIQLHDEEIGLINEDVAANAQLVERGLTSKSNLREAERRLSATRRDALELRSFLARSEQALLSLRQQREALRVTRRSEAAAELQKAELELARMRSRQSAVLDTINELARTAGTAAGRQMQRKLTFTIFREVDGRRQEIRAAEQDEIRPGDILRAELVVETEAATASVN